MHTNVSWLVCFGKRGVKTGNTVKRRFLLYQRTSTRKRVGACAIGSSSSQRWVLTELYVTRESVLPAREGSFYIVLRSDYLFLPSND